MTTPFRFGAVTYMMFPDLLTGTSDEALTTLSKIARYPELVVWEVPYRDGLYNDDLIDLLRRREVLIGTQTPSIQDGWSLSAVDEAERALAVRHLRSALDLAGHMCASYVGLWSGSATSDPQAHKEALARSLEEVATQAEAARTTLLLEPFPDCDLQAPVIRTARQGIDLCNAVDAPVMLMFDPAHHTLADGHLPPVDLENDVRAIGYVQLGSGWQDRTGDRHDHHPAFDDQQATSSWTDMLDLLGWFAEHGYHGPASFEVKPSEARDGATTLHYLAELARRRR